jgi:hypothetical protein
VCQSFGDGQSFRLSLLQASATAQSGKAYVSVVAKRVYIRLNCGKDTIIIWLASLCLSFSMLVVACLVYLSDPRHNVLEAEKKIMLF